MAKGKVARGTKKSGNSPALHGGAQLEQPVSDGIRRAAERSGIEPGIEPSSEPNWSPEGMAAWKAKQDELTNKTLTITLGEACDLVGRDLEPNQFQTQVFEVLARELDVLSDLGEGAEGFEGWCAFMNLRSRIQLAGKIAAMIGGAS